MAPVPTTDPDAVIEPAAGQTWLSRDPRDEKLKVSILGVTDDHVLIKRFKQTRVRRDRFPKAYECIREIAVLPDGRTAEFKAGANRVETDEGITYNVWRPAVKMDTGKIIHDEHLTETVLCSPDDLCGRCSLCRISGAQPGGQSYITSYRESRARR